MPPSAMMCEPEITEVAVRAKVELAALRAWSAPAAGCLAALVVAGVLDGAGGRPLAVLWMWCESQTRFLLGVRPQWRWLVPQFDDVWDRVKDRLTDYAIEKFTTVVRHLRGVTPATRP